MALAWAACSLYDASLLLPPSDDPGGFDAARGRDGRTDDAPTIDAPGVDAAAGDASMDARVDAPIDASKPDVVALGCGDGGNGLRAYWRMDEGAGSSVGDCSPSNNAGTLSGTFSWLSPGRIGASALTFAGAGFVAVGTPASLQITGALTVMAWVRVDAFTNNGRIVTHSGGVGQRGWDLNVEGDGSGAFHVSSDGTAAVTVATPPLQTGTWLHLAGVYDPGLELRIQLDGVVTGRTTTGVPASITSSQEVRLGSRVDCCNFVGAIDDARVYARALSTAEVAALAAQ